MTDSKTEDPRVGVFDGPDGRRLLRKHRAFMRYERRMRRIYPNWRTGTGLPGYPPSRPPEWKR